MSEGYRGPMGPPRKDPISKNQGSAIPAPFEKRFVSTTTPQLNIVRCQECGGIKEIPGSLILMVHICG